MECRLTNSGMIRGPASGAVGDEQGTHRWYRQAKETKCGETNVGESEYAVLPWRQGDSTSWTLRREGRAASWTRGQETRGGHRTSYRVNVMLMDRPEGRRTHDVTSRMP